MHSRPHENLWRLTTWILLCFPGPSPLLRAGEEPEPIPLYNIRPYLQSLTQNSVLIVTQSKETLIARLTGASTDLRSWRILLNRWSKGVDVARMLFRGGGKTSPTLSAWRRPPPPRRLMGAGRLRRGGRDAVDCLERERPIAISLMHPRLTYGLTADMPITQREEVPGTDHVFRLEGLSPDALYHYRIFHENDTTFPRATFRTLGGPGSEVTIALVGDSGTASEEQVALAQQLITIPGAGHFVQQDAAERVTQCVAKWLES